MSDSYWCECGDPLEVCGGMHCFDDEDFDDANDWRDFCECGQIADSWGCDICGAPMCDRCHEGKAGICHGQHTEDELREYAAKIGVDITPAWIAMMAEANSNCDCPVCRPGVEVSG